MPYVEFTRKINLSKDIGADTGLQTDGQARLSSKAVHPLFGKNF